MRKPSKKATDAAVQKAYLHAFNGKPVDMLALPKLYAAGERAILAGKTVEEAAAAMVAAFNGAAA